MYLQLTLVSFHATRLADEDVSDEFGEGGSVWVSAATFLIRSGTLFFLVAPFSLVLQTAVSLRSIDPTVVPHAAWHSSLTYIPDVCF